VYLFYRLGNRGIVINFPTGTADFLQSVQTMPPPPHPPTEWVLGALFPEVKWREREADLLPSLNPEIKNEWSYTDTPPICLMACTGTAFLYLSLHKPAKQQVYSIPSLVLIAREDVNEFLFFLP
jgi:hypothetical protein